ncbi:MAG: class I SAM-dependent methyltransferase [Nitrososphaerota archaeon]
MKILIRSLLKAIPFRVEIRTRRREYAGENDRFSYQARYINFNIKQNERVLDIGSGGYPFPYATVLVERFLEPSRHRHEPLVTNDKPLILADIHNLPFRDKCFDFVYCSHVLEHVDNPLQACAEIMRVGRRGFIETPTMGKDALFAWARDMHKWHVVAIGSNLCFFEYSQRQLEGIRSSAWQEIIVSKWYHPLQEAFYNNQDIFNVMFSWVERFAVFVFHLDGTVESLNAEVRYCDALSNPQHELH